MAEIEALRLFIEQDEQVLISLKKKQETAIFEHVAPKGFRAATGRESVISEAQTARGAVV
ncbi:hypothetical protein [Edaphobacter sp. DSM 109919]|uniref:Uncharacterized protein n=1 Tax=Edaphobacter paludis TaxID=3035702 RepID=A0AAU7CT40_9BACT